MPGISILTPVWNGLPYIKECVASVLAQEFQDWEMVISDNGSTDETCAWLDTITDQRIRIFKQPANLGIFGNLNFLFAQAEAPIACILCADDYLLAGGLATVAREWASHDSPVAFIRFNWTRDLIGREATELWSGVLPGVAKCSQSDALFFLFGNVPGNLSNVSVRTGCMREAGGFRENLPYAGDFEFWARCGRRWPFAVSSSPVTHVRRHPGAATVYLNRKGELVCQAYEVLRGLFAQLLDRVPVWVLRFYATANYDTRQRDSGIATLIRRADPSYLRIVEKAAAGEQMFLGPVMRWMVYLFTAGGRLDVARSFAARRLARRFL